MFWFLLGLIGAAVSVLLVIDHEMGSLDAVLSFLHSMPAGVGAFVAAFFGTLIGIGLWREMTSSPTPAAQPAETAKPEPVEPVTDAKPDPKPDPKPEPKLVCRAAEIEKANDKWRRQERDDRLRARHEDEEERARERRTLASALIHEVTALTRALEDRRAIYKEHDKKSKKDAVVPKLLLPEARVFAANTHIVAGMDNETAGALAELNVALQDAVQIVEFRANDEIVQIKAGEVVEILDRLLKQAKEVQGLLELSVKEASVPMNLNSVA